MIIEKPYEILGLQANASLQEVKQAHRKLAKTWHPDRFLNNPHLKQEAEKKIRQINQAYEALKSYRSNCKNLALWGNYSSSGHNKSVTASSSAITIELRNPDFYYQKGVTNAKLKQYDRAIADFSQAIFLDPEHIKAYQYRGYIQQKLGLEAIARIDFDRVDYLYELIFASYRRSL
jgi:tetratricopeptide (TPR) repeat protein